jgi:hypothetical protein
MHTEYTPEEVRTLLTEHETLEYGSATDADIAEAADVLEGIEELVCKLDPASRCDELLKASIPVADHLYVEVIRNCSRAAGVAIDPEGATSFMVTGKEGLAGDDFPTYFSARQAAAEALLGAGMVSPEAGAQSVEIGPAIASQISRVADENGLVSLLKESGWAIPVGRTVADVDASVLAAVYRLSEEGVAHLFATEAQGGIVLAMAGSTEGDRKRAVERLGRLAGRVYSSRPFSVLFECGEAGSHYSEESWFGHTLKEAPRPREVELDDAAERFRASRFLRPSKERPLEVEAMRRRTREQPFMRAAVRAAFGVDTEDAEATYRAVVVAVAIARIFSRVTLWRALAAEKPWDSKAERGRMQATGRRLRYEIVAGRKARGGEPAPVIPASVLDTERRERLAAPAEDPRLRREVERRRKSGRAAYDTARAIYLQCCPDLAHKLLHLLRRDGASGAFEHEFVSRHLMLAEGAASPEGAVRAALRSLAEAGKLRRVRSAKTRQIFLVPADPLDETGYRRTLNGLIRDERCGVVNPWAETGAAEVDDEAEEWEQDTQDLEAGDHGRLTPRTLRDTTSYEQPLPVADLVAELAAQEEIDSVA